MNVTGEAVHFHQLDASFPQSHRARVLYWHVLALLVWFFDKRSIRGRKGCAGPSKIRGGHSGNDPGWLRTKSSQTTELAWVPASHVGRSAEREPIKVRGQTTSQI